MPVSEKRKWEGNKQRVVNRACWRWRPGIWHHLTSQMLPLGVASHPEWWSTRLQALTPRYHCGMEAGRERPAKHVTREEWGLRVLRRECCDYLTMTQGGQEIKTCSISIFDVRYFIFTAITTSILVREPKAEYQWLRCEEIFHSSWQTCLIRAIFQTIY